MCARFSARLSNTFWFFFGQRTEICMQKILTVVLRSVTSIRDSVEWNLLNRNVHYFIDTLASLREKITSIRQQNAEYDWIDSAANIPYISWSLNWIPILFVSLLPQRLCAWALTKMLIQFFLQSIRAIEFKFRIKPRNGCKWKRKLNK